MTPRFYSPFNSAKSPNLHFRAPLPTYESIELHQERLASNSTAQLGAQAIDAKGDC